MVSLFLIIIFGSIYAIFRYIDQLSKICNAISMARHMTWDTQKLYIKIFLKGLYLTTKNRILNMYLTSITSINLIMNIYNIKRENNDIKYKIIGAIDTHGRDISWIVKEYFKYINMPTTQSLELFLGCPETVVLFMSVNGKPMQLTIDLENRKIIEQNRSLIGGLITFDDEDEEEIEDLSE